MIEMKKGSSSLDLFWKQAFRAIDAWVNRENFRDEFLLQSAKNLVINLKVNQKDRRELVDQFSKELSEWVKASREEGLTLTTVFQNQFPIKSYEEINHILDDIQQKLGKIALTPYKFMTNGEYVDNLVSAVEKYVEIRRSGRNRYVNTVKTSMSTLKEYQRKSINMLTSQVKNVIFPYQKYMVPTDSVSSES